MPRPLFTAALLSLSLGLSDGLASSPAFGITRQAEPRNADCSSRLVDPDEQADRMSDQSRRSERAARHDMRDHRSLVAPTAPAAASFGGVLPR